METSVEDIAAGTDGHTVRGTVAEAYRTCSLRAVRKVALVLPLRWIASSFENGEGGRELRPQR